MILSSLWQLCSGSCRASQVRELSLPEPSTLPIQNGVPVVEDLEIQFAADGDMAPIETQEETEEEAQEAEEEEESTKPKSP